MRALLQESLFAPGAVPDTALIEILLYAQDGRHRVLVDEPRSDRVNAWMSRQSEELGAEVEWLLEASMREEVTDPSRLSIEIHADGTDDWNKEIPLLSVQSARRFLRLPARILVENDINDKAFLLAVSNEEIAKLLCKWEKENWLSFDMAGGIEGMSARIEALENDLLQQKRFVAIFDSDSLIPNRPSKTSEKVAKICENRNLHYHQLARRAIENYVPIPAIYQKVVKSSPRKWQVEFRNRAGAYKSMPLSEHRHHFNVKKGFKQDAARHDYTMDVAEFYATVESVEIAKLERGLDPKLADVFSDNDQRIEPGWLAKDGSSVEIEAIVEKILSTL